MLAALLRRTERGGLKTTTHTVGASLYGSRFYSAVFPRSRPASADTRERSGLSATIRPLPEDKQSEALPGPDKMEY